MRKTFTILSAAALLAAGAQAAEKTQEVTVEFIDSWYDEPIAQPQQTTVTYNEGVFTIENFVNTGLAINFAIPTDKAEYEDPWSAAELTILP